ncbi:DUF3533 domain-containing protein [Kitasatospora sp. NPDC052896]|uniref:YhgE/Pip domain-containing protein n=1 Tax=Kitasatospora sp. NPDC052896 TaxID=3364061 RepID=UPI0037C6796C
MALDDPDVPHTVPGIPHATAGRLLRRPGLWGFPTLIMIIVTTVLTLAYMGGILNPTGNLHHFPMAVVNQDQSVRTGAGPLDAGELDLGPRIAQGIASMPDPGQRVQWRVMSMDQAQREMDKDALYGAVVIPAGFSADTVALTRTADGDAAPRQPALELLTNPRSGSMATSIAQGIGDQVAQTVSQQVAATLAQHAGPAGPTVHRVPTAEAILLADPVTLHTVEHRPLGNHSGFGLSSFYVSLLLTLTAYLTAGFMSSTVDFALGYQSSERGRRWALRLPLPITRTQTLLAKMAMSVALAPVTATVVLGSCAVILHMDTSHFAQLWIYSVCATIAIGVSAQAVLSLLGGLGTLVGMLFFVALAVPSSGGSFPLQAVPAAYRWLAVFEPMRQINEGVRSLLYFDGRADAGLLRAWIMIAVGCALGLLLGLVVAKVRDLRGHQRLTARQLTAVHSAASAAPLKPARSHRRVHPGRGLTAALSLLVKPGTGRTTG